MAITGSLKELNIVDILQMLSLSQKSGIFKIINTIINNTAVIYIYNGKVILSYLSSRNIKDKLLSEIDDISNRAKYDANYSEINLGEFLKELLDDNIISKNHLIDIITKEIMSVIYKTFKWEEGNFSFDDYQIDKLLPVGILPSIKIENLIMEGSRQIDEWTIIESKIKSLTDTVVFDMESEDINEINLTPKEWMVISLINGKRSVQDIIDKSGEEFETAKTIYGLITTGICKLIPKDGEKIIAKTTEQIIKLIENGKFNNAVEAIRDHRLIENSPNVLLLLEAEIYWKTGQLDLAAYNYEKYLNNVNGHSPIKYDLTLSYIFTGNINKAYTIINSIKKDELSFELIEKVEKLKALLNESCNLKNDRIPIYQRIEYEGSE
ncbi:hypothetical protein DRP43_01255 [candidate division TA06 bacterium]|uniref:PatA-like N-terminal domain-containing protein n=1 Tax=candidate division TA06 bacterium TaxID=2250710 RepID=A0A660SQ89_UNCT6|nr:MAG: hypothetical protein DRP43_01255 [candidate division TA06 bacterium]